MLFDSIVIKCLLFVFLFQCGGIVFRLSKFWMGKFFSCKLYIYSVLTLTSIFSLHPFILLKSNSNKKYWCFPVSCIIDNSYAVYYFQGSGCFFHDPLHVDHFSYSMPFLKSSFPCRANGKLKWVGGELSNRITGSKSRRGGKDYLAVMAGWESRPGPIKWWGRSRRRWFESMSALVNSVTGKIAITEESQRKWIYNWGQKTLPNSHDANLWKLLK